jgi:fluoride exporter
MGDWREMVGRALWIGAGGFFGSAARYLLAAWVYSRWGTAFPWGTLVVNVVGSFLLGVLMSVFLRAQGGMLTATYQLALVVGLLGGFTTFSTFAYETLSLAQGGSWPRALANILVSVGLALLAAWGGIRLGRLLLG